MVSENILNYISYQINKALKNPKNRHILNSNSSFYIMVNLPNNFTYKVLLNINNGKYRIINIKPINLLTNIATDTKSINEADYKVVIIPPENSEEIANSLYSIVKEKVYNDLGYPAFREIFQNSLGAVDINDKLIKYGATRILFELGKEKETNKVNSCMLIDNGCGMDLKICIQKDKGKDVISNKGIMGIYLWAPTTSTKRLAISYLGSTETSRINTNVAGYFGIGFLSFVNVFKKVAVLSKMKNNDFAFTMCLDSEEIAVGKKSNFYSYVFSVPKNFENLSYDELISKIQSSETIIYRFEQQEKEGIIKDIYRDEGYRYSFQELPEEVKSVFIVLLEKFIEKLWKERGKPDINKVSGTIIFGHGFNPNFLLQTRSGEEDFFHIDKVINKIKYYTGFERIAGFSKKIRKYAIKELEKAKKDLDRGKITTTIFEKIKKFYRLEAEYGRYISLYRNDTKEEIDLTINDIFELFKQRNINTDNEKISIKRKSLIYVNNNPNLSDKEFKRQFSEGKLDPSDIKQVESKQKFTFSIDIYVIPVEKQYDEINFNELRSGFRYVGDIFLLQNGIPVSPIKLKSEAYRRDEGYKVKDQLKTLNPLSAINSAEQYFYTQIINLNNDNYTNINYNLLVNCNWISVNLGRDSIVHDYKYKYLADLIRIALKMSNKKYLLSLNSDEINEHLEKGRNKFNIVFECRLALLLEKESSVPELKKYNINEKELISFLKIFYNIDLFKIAATKNFYVCFFNLLEFIHTLIKQKNTVKEIKNSYLFIITKETSSFVKIQLRQLLEVGGKNFNFILLSPDYIEIILLTIAFYYYFTFIQKSYKKLVSKYSSFKDFIPSYFSSNIINTVKKNSFKILLFENENQFSGNIYNIHTIHDEEIFTKYLEIGEDEKIYEFNNSLPTNITFLPPYNKIEKSEIEEIKKEHPEVLRFMNKIVRTGNKIIEFLLQEIIKTTNYAYKVDCEDETFNYTQPSTDKKQQITFPFNILGYKLTFERLCKFLNLCKYKNSKTEISKKIKLELVKTKISEIGFYVVSEYKIGLNTKGKLYKYLKEIYFANSEHTTSKFSGITQKEKENLLYILLYNFITHELAHEPIISLLIATVYEESVSHIFPQFACSIDFMNIRLPEMITKYYNPLHKKTRKIKRTKTIEGQKGIKEFFPSNVTTKIVNILNIYNNNKNYKLKCPKCHHKYLIKISSRINFCPQCNLILKK